MLAPKTKYGFSLSKIYWGTSLVENIHCNAGDVGLVPGWSGTKIPQALEQLNPHITTRESMLLLLSSFSRVQLYVTP